MFTGIIEERGTVQEVRKTKSGVRLTVRTKGAFRESAVGSSLSVEGICLTVVTKKGKDLSFDVSQNSLRQTTLGNLRRGDFINLERPLKIGSRVSGHFVQGHVDGAGLIKDRWTEGKNLVYKIKCTPDILSYLVPRASIAIDGISLTVTEVNRHCFTLYLIPHTIQVTTLAKKKVGDQVNIEVDLLSKLLVRRINRHKR